MIVLILIFVLFMFIIYNSIRIFYNRNLKTYKTEIKEYLNNKNFELVDTISPNKKDWLKSPFKKPSDFSVRLIRTKPFCWSHKEYIKIIANREDKSKEFWLEIYTAYFTRPTLTFKEGAKINNYNVKSDSLKSKQPENIIIVKNNCPACGFKLINNEIICPDCKLNFG